MLEASKGIQLRVKGGARSHGRPSAAWTCRHDDGCVSFLLGRAGAPQHLQLHRVHGHEAQGEATHQASHAHQDDRDADVEGEEEGVGVEVDVMVPIIVSVLARKETGETSQRTTNHLHRLRLLSALDVVLRTLHISVRMSWAAQPLSNDFPKGIFERVSCTADNWGLPTQKFPHPAEWGFILASFIGMHSGSSVGNLCMFI